MQCVKSSFTALFLSTLFLAPLTHFSTWAQSDIFSSGGDVSGGGGGFSFATMSSRDILIFKNLSEKNNFADFQNNLVGVTALHQKNILGEGIGIAVLDTGISPQHPSISKVVAFKDFVNNKNNKYVDGNSHGSFVASLISRTAPKAHLVICRVLDEQGGGDSSKLLEAMKWVRSNKKKYNIRVLNLSLTGMVSRGGMWNRTDDIREEIKNLKEAGIVVVVAVGNEAQSFIDSAPADSPDAVTIGSYNHHFSSENSDDSLSPFTNIGWTSVAETKRVNLLFFESINRDYKLSTHKPDLLAPGQWVAGYIEPGSVLERSLKYLQEITETQNPDQLQNSLLGWLSLSNNPLMFKAFVRANPEFLRNLLLSQGQKLISPTEALLNGTSFAAPFVSGGLALLFEMHPQWSATEIMDKAHAINSSAINGVPVFSVDRFN